MKGEVDVVSSGGLADHRIGISVRSPARNGFILAFYASPAVSRRLNSDWALNPNRLCLANVVYVCNVGADVTFLAAQVVQAVIRGHGLHRNLVLSTR